MKKIVRISAIVLMIAIFFSVFSNYSVAENRESEGMIQKYMNITGTVRPNLHTEFVYSDSMLLVDARYLSTDVAKASVNLAGAGYSSSNVNAMLSQMEFDSYVNYQFGSRTIDDNDHVAYTIGKKVIYGDDGTKYNLMCVVVKGTSADEEWFSNMNLGKNNGGNHEGFYKAAGEVYSTMLANIGSNPIIWVTGHSRGAAVANILAGWCTEKYGGEHVFGYTFACPNVSKNVSKFSNIHNFNNSGDLIAIIPLEDWGYSRYGITHEWNYASDVQAMGASYNGAYNTIQYELALKEIVPSEEDYYNASSYFGMMFIAYLMQDNGSTTWDQFLEKYGGQWIEDSVMQKLKSCMDIIEAVASMGQTNDDMDEAEKLLKQVQADTEGYTDDQFAEYLLEHKETIGKIAKITGKVIEKIDDVPSVLSVVLKTGSTAWTVGSVLGCVIDLCDYTTGSIVKAIPGAHAPDVYVLAINRKYYGYRAYQGSSITSVKIPDDVLSIGSDCFSGCSSLVEVDLGQVKAIGKNGFNNCVLLTNLEFSNTIESIGSKAFYNCSELSGNFPISEKTKIIDEYAFYGCAKLTGVVNIPNGCTIIKEATFYGCSSMEEVIIPDSVESIGGYAFLDCTGLKKVTLPISANYNIDSSYGSFEGCSNVEEIGYTAGNGEVFAAGSNYSLPQYAKEALTTVSYTEGIAALPTSALYDCSNVTTVNLPKTLTSVSDFAFSGCIALTEMRIPESVTQIGNFAFKNCSAWTGSFPIWETTENIGRDAFNNCKSLTGSVKIPDGYTVIFQSTFNGCSGMTEVIIPDSVANIEGYAFKNCSGLRKVTLPVSTNYVTDVYKNLSFKGCGNVEDIVYTVGNGEVFAPGYYSLPREAAWDALITVTYAEGITALPPYALYLCSKVTTVNLPETLTSVSDYAFCDCSSLVNLSEMPNITTIGKQAFCGCSALVEMTIPESVTQIGASAFSNCSAWTGSFPIWETTENIGGSAFSNCKSLTGSVKIPDGYTVIYQNTFNGCSGMTELIIPDSVVNIEDYAFQDCSGLKKVTLPVSANYNIRYASTSSFSGCNTVEEIVYTAGNGEVFAAGYDYSLPQYAKDALTTVTYAEGVTALPPYALYNCSKVTTVNFPTTLTAVSDYAFYSCSSLVNLSEMPNITTIGNYAFCGCSALVEMTIPERVTQIGASAFSGCSAWTGSFPIWETTENIGRNAFKNCKSLTGSVMIPSCNIGINAYTFNGCIGMTEVIIPDSVESIGNGAFLDCSGLKKVTLPVSANYILASSADGSFEGCSNVEEIIYTVGNGEVFAAGSYSLPQHAEKALTTVTYTEGITALPPYALYLCSKVATVNLPETLTSVSDSAFSGCSGLSAIEIPRSVTAIEDGAFRGCNRLSDITFLHDSDCTLRISNYAFDVSSLLNTTLYVPDASIVNAAIMEYRWSDSKRNVIYATIPDSSFGIVLETEAISIGVPVTLAVKNMPADTSTDALTWSVNDETVAQITQEGILTFSRAGFVTINVSIQELSLQGELEVECEGTQIMVLPNMLSIIEEEAFCGNSMEVVVVPESVQFFEAKAFAECPNLYKVVMLNSETVIDEDAFDGSPYVRIVYENTDNSSDNDT